MKIFTLLNGYLPGFRYGGPVQTVANMVRLMPPEHRFYIFTRNHDHGDERPYPGIEFNTWLPLGPSHVYYASPSHEVLANLLKEIRQVDPDVIYANSFFASSTARVLFARRLGLLKRPLVIAPRGEMAPSALAMKRWKKLPYLTLLRASGGLGGVTFHASTELERAQVQRALSHRHDVVIAPNVRVAPDIVAGDAASKGQRVKKQVGRARLVFLSRVSAMKNLIAAIECVARVGGTATLDIYGPIGDHSYWERCQAKIGELGAGSWITYRGAVRPEEVIPTLGRYDFLLLPTMGENFGHVIFEGLSAGTPVILSDRTPWKLDADGAGWCLPLGDPDEWVRVVRSCVDMTPGEHAIRSRNASLAASRSAADRQPLEQMVELFRHAVGYGAAQER
jgi:glycosyltransferase involved in cell wall biosynthesis